MHCCCTYKAWPKSVLSSCSTSSCPEEPTAKQEEKWPWLLALQRYSSWWQLKMKPLVTRPSFPAGRSSLEKGLRHTALEELPEKPVTYIFRDMCPYTNYLNSYAEGGQPCGTAGTYCLRWSAKPTPFLCAPVSSACAVQEVLFPLNRGGHAS